MEVLTRDSFQLLVSVRPCWKLRTRAMAVERYTNTARFNRKTATDAAETPKKSAREREAVLNYWYMNFVEKERRKQGTGGTSVEPRLFKLSPALHGENIKRDISQSDHSILYCFWFPGNLIFIFPASSHFRLASRSNGYSKPKNSQERKVYLS